MQQQLNDNDVLIWPGCVSQHSNSTRDGKKEKKNETTANDFFYTFK